MAYTVTEWIGNSGQTYHFKTYALGVEFKPLSGVYILCRRLATGNFEALYVGEAQSLYDRLNAGLENHRGYKCALGRGMTHISANLIEGGPERLRIETDLRHGLDPRCNLQTVPETVILRRLMQMTR